MNRNIEIKARIASVEALIPRAAALSDEGPTLIQQDDSFFACAQGRLKLRQFGTGEGELIFYRRSDAAGPKTSFYLRSPTNSPDSLREVLTLAHGSAGRVQKQRTLFIAGRTRIHLDQVLGLGDFLELEVMLKPEESEADGVAEAHAWMAKLGVESNQLVQGAYVDLLRAEEAKDLMA